MKRSNIESGFSLIELLLVVVIIGIIAAVAVPAYQKSKRAAENGSTFSTMRTIASTQVAFYSQNDRFGRLPELQNMLGHGLGTTVDDRIIRGTYVFDMPGAPSNDDLKREYLVAATRSITGEPMYRYELTEVGRIAQTFPVGAPQE